MNLQPTDILIRKTDGTETLWLSQRLIMEVCGISESYFEKRVRTTYKKSVRACDLAKSKEFLPDSGKAWRWAKTSGGFYYCLNNIPNRAPKYYRSMFGDADALAQKYEDFINNNEMADFERLFKKYLNKNYTHYLEFYNDANEVQKIALAKACAVLDFLLEYRDDYPGTKNKIYKDTAEVLKKLDLQYIPHHYLRLKEKIDELFATETLSIPDIIKLPRQGNNNALVYDDNEVKTWVMQLRQMPQNYSNEHIIRKVLEQCEFTGKKAPSRRWFGKTILELPSTKFLTYKRFGSSRKSHIAKGYIPFQNALFAGDCWEIDATRVNIISHEVTSEDENGKKVKSEKFLMIIAVRDVYSGDVLGYSFSHAENHLVYADALKMAVQETGYLPYEIVTDRFPGHNHEAMVDFFERLKSLGTNVEFSHSPNAKASIERSFRTVQSITMQDSDYYYGEGIMSRSLSAFRSPEYLAKIKKDSKKAGFDMYKAVEESTHIIEAFRNTPYSKYSRKHRNLHQSPVERHNESEKPHIIEVSQATVSMLFGLKKSAKITGDGQINTEILGTKMTYYISPAYYDIIEKYHNQSVVMSYDIEDLNTVFLWEPHGRLLKSLCEAEYFEKPQKYGPDKTMQQVGVAKARQRAINELREQRIQEVTGEENLLLGKLGKKDELNTADDYYENITIPLKKASGSDVQPDDFESSYLKNYRNEL